MKRYTTTGKKLLFCLGTILIVFSCVDPDLESEIDERPILLMAGKAYDPTRAVVETTELQSTMFEEGEKINVWITGESDDVTTTTEIGDYPCVFTTREAVDGKNLLDISPEKQPYYHVGRNSRAHIFAAYPANEQVNVTLEMTKFTVQSDQTTPEGYKNSDLMMVEPFDHNKTANIVNLPFKHKMTKLIVNAIGDSDDNNTITIDNVVTIGYIQRSVDIDVANGRLLLSTDPQHAGEYAVSDDNPNEPTQRTIQILNGGAALFPPQFLRSATGFIKVTGTLNGTPATALFDIINKNFEEGRVYKLNLHIGKDNFTPNSDNSPNTSTITGWSEDYDELTVTPSGGYAGVQIATIDGHVAEMDNTLTPDEIKDGNYLYTGKPCCPRPQVTYGTTDPKVLTEGIDFRYVYVDNVNAGTNSQVMVLGIGSYAGLAALKPFRIERATAKISFAENSDTIVAFNPDENIGFKRLINTGDGNVTYSVIADGEDEDAGCASVDPVDGVVTLQNQGKCTIKATAATGRNYDYPGEDNTCTYKLTIQPREVKVGNLTVTYEPLFFTFDGTEKKMTKLVVADDEHTLVEGVDYTYTFKDKEGRYEGAPVHHGTALLTVTGKGNYDKNTKIEIEIPINQAKPTLTVKTTDLALGQYKAAAPKDRRKTREATTEEWAKANIRYSLSASEDVTENTYVRVGKKNGLLTGLAVHSTENTSDGSTTVYVNVDADTSQYHDWVAADQKSFNVKVYQSDFTFKIKRYAYSDYREPQLHIESDGIPEGAHTRWVCPAKGEWQIDCYGAQGGTTPKYTTERLNHYRTQANSAGPVIKQGEYPNQGQGGRGAHIAGRIKLPKGMVLHVNLGQKGRVVYPGEQRLRGTESEICTVVSKANLTTTAGSSTKNGNMVNRGHSGGKVNGNLGYIKAGDYEWAAFAWNGGGGMIWGAHHMYQFPWFYVQDNYWLGNCGTTARSPAAVTAEAMGSFANQMGQSFAMFPITGGGGATDVSLAWDEDGGVYTPPTTYTEAELTSTEKYTYSDQNRAFSYDASKYDYRFEKWMTAHNMVNREYGVGVNGDDKNMVGLQWKNPAHLYSRIIVAGGGGGALYYDSSNTFGDGGNGGAWEGTRGLWQDYGEGGYINAGGRGGIMRNWKMGTESHRQDNRVSEYNCSGQSTTYPSDLCYNDGPNGGGWSGTDGMFGEGGNTFQPAQGCGGGGGGWYGGGAGNEDYDNGPGGGGSSFLWTDKESLHTYVSSAQVPRSAFTYTGINHTVSWGSERKLYENYDYLDVDYKNYNGFEPEKWHKKAANFYQFMPTNATARLTRGSNLGIECPFFHQVVTKDAGANAGDGWAKITLVEIDDDQ